MARPAHLFVFTHDVVRDSVRNRLAALLEVYMDRVQLSVFEGRMTLARARQLAREADGLLGPDDSLRIYAVTEAGRRASMVLGKGSLAEAHDFIIL